jgi:hypothetical protein
MTMDSKHTPGPWIVSGVRRKIGGMDCIRITREADGGEVAYVQQTDTITKGWGLPLNDAKLLAAAPDMLEALKTCEEMVSTQNGPPNWDWVRQVIAKAEGREART